MNVDFKPLFYVAKFFKYNIFSSNFQIEVVNLRN